MASHKTVESLPCQLSVVVDEADGADLIEKGKRLSTRRRGRFSVVVFFLVFFVFFVFACLLGVVEDSVGYSGRMAIEPLSRSFR